MREVRNACKSIEETNFRAEFNNSFMTKNNENFEVIAQH